MKGGGGGPSRSCWCWSAEVLGCMCRGGRGERVVEKPRASQPPQGTSTPRASCLSGLVGWRLVPPSTHGWRKPHWALVCVDEGASRGTWWGASGAGGGGCSPDPHMRDHGITLHPHSLSVHTVLPLLHHMGAVTPAAAEPVPPGPRSRVTARRGRQAGAGKHSSRHNKQWAGLAQTRGNACSALGLTLPTTRGARPALPAPAPFLAVVALSLCFLVRLSLMMSSSDISCRG